MEDLPKRSHLLNRSGHYYLRVRVPKDLCDHFSKKEIKVSLKTKDLKEAKSRLSLEQLKVEEQFAAARRNIQITALNTTQQPLMNNPIQPSNTDLERIVQLWHREQSTKSRIEDDQLRTSLSTEDRSLILGNLHDDLAIYSSHEEANYSQPIYAHALELFKNASLPLNGLSSELKSHLYDLIKQALIEQTYDSLKRYGEYHNRIPFQMFAEAHTAEAKINEITAPSEILTSLITKFCEAKRSDGVTEKSLVGYKLTFDFAIELFGKNKSINTISSADCRNFRDKLTQLPSNAKKKYPQLSLMQALEKHPKGAAGVLSATSVNGHMKNLSAIFNFAVRERLIDANPASHIKSLKIKKNFDEHDPFTYDELQRLFATPIYTGCKNDERCYNKAGKNKPRRHRFWIPLIALYTGMRLNEICQLFTDDIGCIDGIPVIHIRIDEADVKTLKNDQSARTIPIHKNLIQIGFLDYVEKIKLQSKRQLFPYLPVSKRESLSDNFSKWFGRFLKASKLKRTKTRFHSFRHSFRDECRNHDINTEITEKFCGWKGSGSTMNNYGKGHEMKILQAEMNKIHSNLKLTI